MPIASGILQVIHSDFPNLLFAVWGFWSAVPKRELQFPVQAP